ncbi:CapA family protein [Bdellovibrio sp. 22V]|uniref:CapA family protein n=1 Tax=Bdellovibrio TaxID=958 RepID=UPI002543DB21|nr:CapA family protein [Bdellovibrio sp. 22V]WII73845.1 CapA family protein [Bdellovibrio sp. 22V]
MKKIIFVFLTFPLWVQASKDLQFSSMCDSQNDVVTLSFVGDILIHKMLYDAVVRESQQFSQIWNATDYLMKKSHFSVANLEGASALGIDKNGKDHGDIGFVNDGVVYSGTGFSFNYHPRILTNLKNSGYDLLTLANNHSLDRRSIGIDKTIQAARQAGLLTVGTRIAAERNATFYKIVTIRQTRVAFLGCTEMTNGHVDSNEQILYCFNSGVILPMIRELASRSDVDAVVVLPHWGVEYTHTPSSAQKEFARKYLEAGALAVIGSHPHVLQPWEKYVTRDGRETIVIYSLGNFVAGQKDLSRRTGVVAYLGLHKTGNARARLVGAGYTPTYRTGTKLAPISSSGPADVLKHTAQMYGTKGRVEPNQDLISTFCPSGR